MVGLGRKFLDNGSQPSLNGSPRNLRVNEQHRELRYVYTMINFGWLQAVRCI